MFKQISLMVFTSVFSYVLTFYILRKNYRRFYFINGIVKYPLRCKIKNASYIQYKDVMDLDNFIFYSQEPINTDNYIYDKTNDTYYIVEPGYYYYINKRKNTKNDLEVYFNPNSFIFYIKIKS